MVNILLDTHIFIRLTVKLSDLLECISLTGDTIVLSSEIEDEYRPLARIPTYLGYMSYRIQISERCNLRDIGTGRIEARYKRYKREIRMPKHNSDHKWIKTAISEHARYIITNDPDLSRPPFQTNDDICSVIYPENYIQDNCNS